MDNISDQTYITVAPLTSEAREKLIDDNFSDVMPHYGELFIPGNSFYTYGDRVTSAINMTKMLCTWLGIKPGYVGLEFESKPESNTKGHDFNIYIESMFMDGEFLLGAYLAKSISKYMLEERKKIFLESSEQQSLVILATVTFGLGLIMGNALDSKRSSSNNMHLLRNFSSSEYVKLLNGYFWQKTISKQSYSSTLSPWLSDQLNVPKSKNPSLIVKQSYFKQKSNRYQWVGLFWVITLGVGIGIYVRVQDSQIYLSSRDPNSSKIQDLQKQYNECKNLYDYDTQYSDSSDIQASRSLNSDKLKCQSILYQLNSAEQNDN